MTYFDYDVIYARKCPYCGGEPELIDSVYFYDRSYGMVWACKPCNAYVGCHSNSKKHAPKGRLANAKLRKLKKEAHYYFDALWKRAWKGGREYAESRRAAYKWLSTELDIPNRFCHIGMFDESLCQKTIDICKKYK